MAEAKKKNVKNTSTTKTTTKKSSNTKSSNIKNNNNKKTSTKPKSTTKVSTNNKTTNTKTKNASKNTYNSKKPTSVSNKQTTTKTTKNNTNTNKKTTTKPKSTAKKTSVTKINDTKNNYEIEDYIEKVYEENNFNKDVDDEIIDSDNELYKKIIDAAKEEQEKTNEVSIEEIHYKKVKKLKLKKKNLFILIILAILFSCLVFSIYKVIEWSIYNHFINKEIDRINNVADVIEVTNEENVEIIENNIDEADPYWDYIKMNLIDVDFNELKNENSDTKGWIQVNGTNINYPFVQSTDNDFYLTHAFDKSYNDAGWVFLDFRNDITKEERNTIIYGHSRRNRTMFGSLKNILSSDWLNNKDNYIIKLSTEYENTLWQIFSVYHIPTTTDYLQTVFDSDIQFEVFVRMLLDRSAYNFETSVSSLDRILTLSTCYNSTDKVVLHAKLIKREPKL